MKRLILAATMAVAIAGCATSGRPISNDQLQTLKVGESTAAQAITAMGAPTTTTSSSDGTQRLLYVFTAASVKAASFIPVVGLFAGGTDVRSDVVTLVFDKQGKLAEVLRSSSATDTSTGLSAGSR